MTTVILVGLIVVLLAAATYVGVLLVRRSRSAPAEAEPATGLTPGARARWRTCSSGGPSRPPSRPTTRPPSCPATSSSFPRFRGRTR